MVQHNSSGGDNQSVLVNCVSDKLILWSRIHALPKHFTINQSG
jgi:hypothetical protein